MYALVLASEEIAAIDFDERYPYLSTHGDDKEEEEEEDGEGAAPVGKGDDRSVASVDSLSSLKSDSNIPSEIPGQIDRELFPGEAYLRANTSLFDTLLAPAGGVAEKTKKNPLALIFMSGIQEEGRFH